MEFFSYERDDTQTDLDSVKTGTASATPALATQVEPIKDLNTTTTTALTFLPFEQSTTSDPTDIVVTKSSLQDPQAPAQASWQEQVDTLFQPSDQYTWNFDLELPAPMTCELEDVFHPLDSFSLGLEGTTIDSHLHDQTDRKRKHDASQSVQRPAPSPIHEVVRERSKMELEREMHQTIRDHVRTDILEAVIASGYAAFTKHQPHLWSIKTLEFCTPHLDKGCTFSEREIEQGFKIKVHLVYKHDTPKRQSKHRCQERNGYRVIAVLRVGHDITTTTTTPSTVTKKTPKAKRKRLPREKKNVSKYSFRRKRCRDKTCVEFHPNVKMVYEHWYTDLVVRNGMCVHESENHPNGSDLFDLGVDATRSVSEHLSGETTQGRPRSKYAFIDFYLHPDSMPLLSHTNPSPPDLLATHASVDTTPAPTPTRTLPSTAVLSKNISPEEAALMIQSNRVIKCGFIMLKGIYDKSTSSERQHKRLGLDPQCHRMRHRNRATKCIRSFGESMQDSFTAVFLHGIIVATPMHIYSVYHVIQTLIQETAHQHSLSTQQSKLLYAYVLEEVVELLRKRNGPLHPFVMDQIFSDSVEWCRWV